MKNTKKLNFEDLRKIAKDFAIAFNNNNEQDQNKILEPLKSSQLKRLAALFYNLPNKVGFNHALYILTAADHKAYYERLEKNLKNFKKSLKVCDII